MIQRLAAAFSKISFCFRMAADTASFLRIMVNTKKYRQAGSFTPNEQAAVLYRFRPAGISRNVYLRTYAGDIDIFYEVFWKEVYASPDLDPEHIHTLVDLGANVGMASLYFSKAFPKARIFAVEPDPENFGCLEANLQEEINAKRLVALHAGIAVADGTAFIEKKEKAYNISLSTDTRSDIEVRILSMNTLLRESKLDQIDLLKIDIEGWEDQLFSRDTEWLQRVRHIIMECHSPAIKQRCEAVLHANGFRTTVNEHQLICATRS
jgi:FkbM family methyltransferase